VLFSCEVNFKQFNLFEHNSARLEGGATYFQDYNFIESDASSAYQLNTAPFNPIWASSPKSGWIEFLRNNDYFEPYTRSSQLGTSGYLGITADTKFNIYQFYPPTCVPGVPISILVFIANQQDFRVGLTV
jgi:hypothetical protein